MRRVRSIGGVRAGVHCCDRDVNIAPLVRPEAVQQRGAERRLRRPVVRRCRWRADIREACRAPDDAGAATGALSGQAATAAERAGGGGHTTRAAPSDLRPTADATQRVHVYCRAVRSLIWPACQRRSLAGVDSSAKADASPRPSSTLPWPTTPSACSGRPRAVRLTCQTGGCCGDPGTGDHAETGISTPPDSTLPGSPRHVTHAPWLPLSSGPSVSGAAPTWWWPDSRCTVTLIPGCDPRAAAARGPPRRGQCGRPQASH
eukprot:COSAG03_NODE_1534_length_3914_cov_2.897248_3_plen_260_part_00